VKQDAIDRTLARAGWDMGDETLPAVISRLYRVISHVDRRLAEAFSDVGLKHGEVDVLYALLAGGEDPQSPSRVAASLMCSTGAMTNRLDRLEKAGYLRRQHDTADRRSILLSITPAGRAALERAALARDAVEAEILPGLTMAERRQLTGLLRQVLVAFEPEGATEPAMAAASRTTP
jgi:DNA-binding MarR family transcriptional regulator